MRAEVQIHRSARLNGDKEKIKDEILNIYQRDGVLKPSALIKAAKPKKSLLIALVSSLSSHALIKDNLFSCSTCASTTSVIKHHRHHH